MVTKSTLKPWFSNGKKPDEKQFWAWMDSYWHKDEKISIDVIEDINNILSKKADSEVVNILIAELETKVDKIVIEALQSYVYGLIDDSVSEASDKTYSINKIRELTSDYLTEAVTDIDYNAETGTLLIEYEKDESKEINLGKGSINIIKDDLEKGKENTYSIDKIRELIFENESSKWSEEQW